MKKLAAVFVVLILIIIVFIYTLIPNIITVNESVIFQNNAKGLFRTLCNERNWQKWWAGNDSGEPGKLMLHDTKYTLSGYTPNTISLNVENTSFTAKPLIVFIPLQSDSIQIEWQAKVATSYNPLKRLQIYFKTAELKNDFKSILRQIKTYYTDDEKIYGIDIRRESVKDTALIFTYDSSNNYPSTEKIYSLIDELKKYIDSHGAIAADSPMLNIYTSDSIHYLTKVAIPANKILPSSGKIYYKWMLPHGNILVADVKGNRKTTDSAFAMMENYVQDYNLKAPAIPFLKLITNRLAEKDSTKWITRIYYPIMYYK